MAIRIIAAILMILSLVCEEQKSQSSVHTKKKTPSLVQDENGEIYSVRYHAVNAMLLNEFLKEHREVEERQSELKRLRRPCKQ